MSVYLNQLLTSFDIYTQKILHQIFFVVEKFQLQQTNQQSGMVTCYVCLKFELSEMIHKDVRKL